MDFKGKNILVAGDVMLDRYVYGRVERISPEAPIPVLAVESEEIMLGGAGNVVRNLSALGANVFFVSVLDKDTDGYEIAGLLGNTKGVEAHLVYEIGRGTTVKTRYVSGQQIVRADRENTSRIKEKTERAVVQAAISCLPDCDALIISDYGKGVIDDKTARALIGEARDNDIPIIVDPKNPDWSIYKGATVITPNDQELKLAKLTWHDFGWVLITRGRHGMTLLSGIPLSQEIHINATAKEVYDVSGAGDTVVAVIALGLASGMDMLEAAKLANKAAGIVVGKRGTATVTTAELESA